jgi:GLPGLI family protein
MKKIFLFVVLQCLSVSIFAQKNKTTEGVISFEEKTNLHKMIRNPQAKAQMPEFRTTQMELYFKDKECLYVPVEDAENGESDNAGGGGMRMKMRMQAEIYRNFANNKQIEQRDIMNNTYLIEDTLNASNWEFQEGATLQIAGFDCKKAIRTDSMMGRKQQIVVWYTEKIGLNAGPQSFGGLNGMILKVDVNEGEMEITAKNIDFRKVKSSDIKAPTKGERMTRAEFRKKIEDFRKQRRPRPDGN